MSLAFESPQRKAWRLAPVWVGMLGVAALSWLYLVRMQMGVEAMEMAATGMGKPPSQAAMLLPALGMWVVMMLAMMLPTVAPSAAVFGQLAFKRHRATARRAVASYVVGYAVSWVAFAVPAAVLQTLLTGVAWLDPMARSSNTLMSTLILLAAGGYQLSPLKTACLSKCRSPLAYFLAQWRDGLGGAFGLGVRHGGYCVGCCWTLMAVMFVVGAMNLVWMGAITLVVLGEKLAPPSWHLSRVSGVGLVGVGMWLSVGLWLAA